MTHKNKECLKIMTSRDENRITILWSGNGWAESAHPSPDHKIALASPLPVEVTPVEVT